MAATPARNLRIRRRAAPRFTRLRRRDSTRPETSRLPTWCPCRWRRDTEQAHFARAFIDPRIIADLRAFRLSLSLLRWEAPAGSASIETVIIPVRFAWLDAGWAGLAQSCGLRNVLAG